MMKGGHGKTDQLPNNHDIHIGVHSTMHLALVHHYVCGVIFQCMCVCVCVHVCMCVCMCIDME